MAACSTLRRVRPTSQVSRYRLGDSRASVDNTGKRKALSSVTARLALHAA